MLPKRKGLFSSFINISIQIMCKAKNNAAINKKTRDEQKKQMLLEKESKLQEIKDPDKLLQTVTKKVQKY